jgi:hypothetical protein
MTLRQAVDAALAYGQRSINTAGGTIALAGWPYNDTYNFGGQEGWEFDSERPSIVGPWNKFGGQLMRSVFTLSRDDAPTPAELEAVV